MEELSLLRFVLYCAQLIEKGAPLDLEDAMTFGVSPSGELIVNEFHSDSEGLDLAGFVQGIPDDTQREFQGLVEALELYQLLHGKSIPVAQLTLNDKAIYELKQLRDLCLQDGLPSKY